MQSLGQAFHAFSIAFLYVKHYSKCYYYNESDINCVLNKIPVFIMHNYAELTLVLFGDSRFAQLCYVYHILLIHTQQRLGVHKPWRPA